MALGAGAAALSVGFVLGLAVIASGLTHDASTQGPTDTASSATGLDRPSATPTPRPTATSRPGPTPTPPNTPGPNPTGSSETLSGDSFAVLPGQQPGDFAGQITCAGSIEASDSVAIVWLVGDPGQFRPPVLRNYANPGTPTTVCTFRDAFPWQLTDARHVVIDSQSNAYAVVDLPEVQFRWFGLPQGGRFVAVAPRLDAVVWLSAEPDLTGRQVHRTTAAGDRIVASLPDWPGGRCGTPEDSKTGAYSRTGAYFFVLDQPSGNGRINSLLVFEGESTVLSMVPPFGDWAPGAHPAMALWSPTTDILFFRQGGSVWQWSPTGGTEMYLPGVNWYYPTITPDGSHLAYAVVRPDSLHDVYLVDLGRGGSPELIGRSRNQPIFLNNNQLWFKSEGQGICGPGGEEPLIFDLNDRVELPSIIDGVRTVWPATSSNW